jgi:signal transduction histidine kinase
VLPRAWERDPIEGGRILSNLGAMTRSALAEMRTLLLELRPGELLQTGLGELLQQLVDALRSRIDVPIHVEVEGAASALPTDIHVTFYRLAQEALSNIVKHAAPSTVQVKLRCSEDGALMCIRDDGSGFDPPRVRAGHLGLRIMYERAAAIGAALFIDSAPGRGTEVTVRWPLLRAAN